MKTRGTDDHRVLERPQRRLRFRVHPVTHRAALHKDDRVVPILSRDRRRQPCDEPTVGTARDLFEALRRHVMALIYDEVSIFSDTIIYNPLPDDALNERDVNRPKRLAAPAADSPNGHGRDV